MPMIVDINSFEFVIQMTSLMSSNFVAISRISASCSSFVTAENRNGKNRAVDIIFNGHTTTSRDVDDSCDDVDGSGDDVDS